MTSSPDPNPNSSAKLADESHGVSHLDNQNVIPRVQAAQVEHKQSTTVAPIVPLVGGRSPKPPEDTASTKPLRRKTSRKKKRDNHVSVRFQDREMDVLLERMARTGEKQSDALRNLIQESSQKGGSVYLSPKTPPEHLEALLGELRKWRMAFATAKPRLNIPTPAHDDERYAQVVAWRAEADRLLQDIPTLEAMIQYSISMMTNLTPDKTRVLQAGIPTLKHWRDVLANKNKKQEKSRILIQCLLELLADAGITPPKKPK